MSHKAEKPEKTEAQKVRSEAYKKLGILFAVILLGVNTIQLASFGSMVERVDKYNQGLIDELGGIRQDVVTFAGDLNEMRSFLLLPTKEYSFSKERGAPVETEEKEVNNTETAMYTFLNKLIQEQEYSKNSILAEQTIDSLLNDEQFIQSLKENAFKIGQKENRGEFIYFNITAAENDEPLFAFFIDKQSNKPEIKSHAGNENYLVKATELTALKAEILAYCKEHEKSIKELISLINTGKNNLSGLINNEQVKPLFAEKKLSLTAAGEVDDPVFPFPFYIQNSNAETLLTISIKKADGSYQLENNNYKTFEAFLPEFIAKIKNLDAASQQEKMLITRKAELEAVFKEEAFKDLLKNNGLTIAAEPREEYNKVLYDLKNAENKTVLSFAIEISSGMFKIIQDDKELDLYSTLDEGSKKKP